MGLHEVKQQHPPMDLHCYVERSKVGSGQKLISVWPGFMGGGGRGVSYSSDFVNSKLMICSTSVMVE